MRHSFLLSYRSSCAGQSLDELQAVLPPQQTLAKGFTELEHDALAITLPDTGPAPPPAPPSPEYPQVAPDPPSPPLMLLLGLN